MEEDSDNPSGESTIPPNDPETSKQIMKSGQGEDILDKQNINEGHQICLLDLPWEDVIFMHIFPYLSIVDIFNLRSVNKSYKNLASSYIQCVKTIPWELLGPKDVEEIIEETSSLVELNFPYNYHMNDDILKTLLTKNKNISSLSIASCRTVVGTGMYPVIYLKNLTKMNVRKNVWVDNTFIQLITHHLEYLSEVDISFTSVEDISMVPFFKKFNRLKKVEIESCLSLSDISILTLGSCCLNLEFLNISNNKKITLNAISSIIYACKNIQCIELMGCSDFSIPYIKFIDLPIT